MREIAYWALEFDKRAVFNNTNYNKEKHKTFLFSSSESELLISFGNAKLALMTCRALKATNLRQESLVTKHFFIIKKIKYTHSRYLQAHYSLTTQYY